VEGIDREIQAEWAKRGLLALSVEWVFYPAPSLLHKAVGDQLTMRILLIQGSREPL